MYTSGPRVYTRIRVLVRVPVQGWRKRWCIEFVSLHVGLFRSGVAPTGRWRPPELFGFQASSTRE
eukprot:7857234-Pyramimonas_sp.AAC.1